MCHLRAVIFNRHIITAWSNLQGHKSRLSLELYECWLFETSGSSFIFVQNVFRAAQLKEDYSWSRQLATFSTITQSFSILDNAVFRRRCIDLLATVSSLQNSMQDVKEACMPQYAGRMSKHSKKEVTTSKGTHCIKVLPLLGSCIMLKLLVGSSLICILALKVRIRHGLCGIIVTLYRVQTASSEASFQKNPHAWNILPSYTGHRLHWLTTMSASL